VNGRLRWLAASDDHQIDLFINDCPGAKQIARSSIEYTSVELPPEFIVGSEFRLTRSRNAVPGAADFAMSLLSPQGKAAGRSALSRSRFLPWFPCRRSAFGHFRADFDEWPSINITS
jgi:hypothetical protein